MLDFSHIPSQYPNADVQVFVGSDPITVVLKAWQKPRGKTMAHILLVGAGGLGGNGIVGANSRAGGGGGGGSGGQTSIRLPLWAIPDTLYLYLPAGHAPGSTTALIAINSATTVAANDTLVRVFGGTAGGNGTAVPAGGSGGAGGAISTAGLMPLGWQWLQQAIAGQVGAGGGAAVGGGNITLPTTGLLVTGGTGGGGLPAAAAGGNNAGGIPAVGVFPISSAPTGGSTATTPPQNGASGIQPILNLLFNYGGTGGGSSHGSATGAGLFGGNGGNGAPGCGGGGGGACLTGGVAGVGGKGGPAFCIITCW